MGPTEAGRQPGSCECLFSSPQEVGAGVWGPGLCLAGHCVCLFYVPNLIFQHPAPLMEVDEV